MILLSVLFFTLCSLLFGVIYHIMDKIDKSHFNFANDFEAYYFSFSTMSTVGFGDIAPRTTTAKLVVIAQMIVVMSSVLNIVFAMIKK